MEDIVKTCKQLQEAYEQGRLGRMDMPEDAHPESLTEEQRLAYFTLPMALNYQRNSYTLWKSALKTFNDPKTAVVFDVQRCSELDEETLREYLLRYKLALQPNKHITTWQRIAYTIAENWGDITELLQAADHDFLKLQEIIQKQHKKGFPYLSGPKIFHYWCFILQEYAGVTLSNSEYIEIAPDTHIIKCSVRMGVITAQEAETMSRDEISRRWRDLLHASGMTPIQMHAPLWFWSRNGFAYEP